MDRYRFAVMATLVACAGCAQQPGPPAADAYVPHGRFAAAMPRDQALRECRRQVEGAGRQGSPSLGPGALRQIAPPPVPRPDYASIRACMDAKGFRRSNP